jgi:hypothetical protein
MPEESAPREGQIILYSTPEGAARIEVHYEDETFWLTLNRMAELFGATKQAISYHLRQIYASGELDRLGTVKEVLTVQTEGERTVRRTIDFHNLDAIIAVGYRVNSARATQFRIWATQTLKEFIVKGFVLDAFLRFNEYEVLSDAGRVSAEVARQLAEQEYETFRVRQDLEFESDFEREVKRIQSRRSDGEGDE